MELTCRSHEGQAADMAIGDCTALHHCAVRAVRSARNDPSVPSSGTCSLCRDYLRRKILEDSWEAPGGKCWSSRNPARLQISWLTQRFHCFRSCNGSAPEPFAKKKRLIEKKDRVLDRDRNTDRHSLIETNYKRRTQHDVQDTQAAGDPKRSNSQQQ